MRTTIRAALMGALLMVPVAAQAQTYIKQAQLRGGGVGGTATRITGNLDIGAVQSRQVVLPEGATGSGYRWTVQYTLQRTKSSYPNWPACARMDVLSRDGECLDRVWLKDTSGTVSGSFQFYGEDSPQARPHRLRISFSQRQSFPFYYDIRYTAQACTGVNIGGPLREQPVYMATGTRAEPSWVCGDIRMAEGHRAMLFRVKPGAELRALLKPLSGWGGIGGMKYLVYDLNHRLLSDLNTVTSVNSTTDTLLYHNTGAAPAWVILQLAEYYRCDHDLGFYSPQGASPAPGEAIAAPASVNPYVKTGTTAMSGVVAVGGTVRWSLGGVGAMTRMRVRGTKVPFLQGGGIGHVSVTVYSKSGVKLISRLFGTDLTGHCPAETFYELDFSSLDADSPGAVEIKTAYQPAFVELEMTRHARP
jgi:hypothetical protein